MPQRETIDKAKRRRGQGPFRGDWRDVKVTGHVTEADVVGFIPDALGTYGAMVECGCGTRFKFTGIDAGAQPDGAARTGEWSTGACPTCKRMHRVRITTVVNVEEAGR